MSKNCIYSPVAALETIPADQLSIATGGRQLPVGGSRTHQDGVDLPGCAEIAGLPPVGRSAQRTSYNRRLVNDGLETVGNMSWQGPAGGKGRCIVNRHPARH